MPRSDNSQRWRSGIPSKPDIEHLVREMQAGREEDENENFQPLFNYYVPRLLHFFVNRHFRRQDAEDLAQEVLFRVYRKVEAFRFQASFDSWVFSIAISVWKNALRRRDALKRKAAEQALDEVLQQDEAKGASSTVEVSLDSCFSGTGTRGEARIRGHDQPIGKPRPTSKSRQHDDEPRPPEKGADLRTGLKARAMRAKPAKADSESAFAGFSL